MARGQSPIAIFRRVHSDASGILTLCYSLETNEELLEMMKFGK